ncbi:MAG: TerC/Alx family metal homeostasis membrane protein [Chthoniobacterales bacterium]|nr:TerC/Alx family metal homeostasis membrane protein [Chthoniobacterales bacterium]
MVDPVTLLWLIFAVVVVGVCTLDLFVITHSHSPVGVANALRWTGIWVALAMGFGFAIYLLHPNGGTLSTLFIAGYLTEYSLSVDNLFVFILIFSLMAVPAAAQPKLIKVGIYLSILLRILFIVFGLALIEKFHWLLYIFGALLVWTAWKMLVADKDEQVNPEGNILYKLASKLLPMRHVPDDSRRLVIKADGRWFITPLFLVFLVIGSTDILFAVDSIPAIMGISQDPFVVITSNIFAVLGLNSLFFALRGVMGMFKFLQHGVSFILFFIGAKMIASAWPPAEHWFKHNTFFSLMFIVTVLALSIVLSVWHTRTNGEAKP